MPTRRVRRFLHLERARAGGATPPDGRSPSSSDRIAGVKRPPRGAPSGAPPRSGVAPERFGPEPAPRLELEPLVPGARPFTRCVRCGTDHGRFAVSCAGCGARLDTDEQRRANDALWATRQAEAEGEARASAERRAAVAEAAAEDARGRRSMYEELAREVGERERARLGGATSAGDAPIGLVVVRAIRDRRWKLAAVGGAGAAVLGLVGGGLAARSPAAVLAGLAIAIALVAPRGVARRRW